MTWAEYRRMTERQFVGRRVQLLQGIQSQAISLPPGTQGTIRHKWKGFEVRFDPCSHCGAKAIMTQISPVYLMLLPEGNLDPAVYNLLNAGREIAGDEVTDKAIKFLEENQE